MGRRMREVTPTRSAALALADEHRLMREGHAFLDEKRVLLATEILSRLHTYGTRSQELAAAITSAADALAAAVERHGLDQLQVYPMPEAPPAPACDRTTLLGITLQQIKPSADAPISVTLSAIDPSPEATACREAFERVVRLAAEVGVEAGNLSRLAREYRRTERRAKALENVLLPEVAAAIKYVDDQLEAMEREEAIAARWFTIGAP